MKKMFFVFCLVQISKASFGQINLVPNPSFEIYSSCPYDLDQLSKAIGWTSYSITPDYYNVCDTNFVDVPTNAIGNQYAASGNGYSGFQAYDVNGFAREILGNQLSQNLQVGQKYYVTIKVSLAEFNSQSLPCNKIGVKFSTIPYSVSSPVPINNFAHIFSNAIISDTLNWVNIQGSFIADSSYQYVMIGNFFDDLNTNTLSQPNGIKSYYYLDDVCVSTDSLLCYNFDAVKEIQPIELVNIYPNPSSENIVVDCHSSEFASLTLYNDNGEIVIVKDFNGKTILDVSKFNNGLYYVSIHQNGIVISKKVIVFH